jgi:ferredoxin
MTDDESGTYTVTLVVPEESALEQAGERHAIEVPADAYVLYRARQEGIWLPADCQQGWCVTCAGRLLEGELDHSDARRYYEEDEEAGFALLCRAKPRSDCVVEVDRYEAMLAHRADHDRPPGNSKLDR